MPYGADPITPAGYGRDPTQKPAASPQQDETGSSLGAFFRGVLHGVESTGTGIAQFASHISPPAMLPGAAAGQQKLQSGLDQSIAQREQAFQAAPQTRAHPVASGLGTLTGEIGSTALMPGGGLPSVLARTGARALGIAGRLPAAAAPLATVPGRIAQGAALGAAGAATAPVAGGDYWTEKKRQLELGGGIGAALPGVGGTLAPRLPSPQVVGKAFPWLMNFITGAEERTVAGFDRTIGRQVLDPIGGGVPRNLSGHALLNHVQDQIGDAYDKVLPTLNLPRTMALGPVDPDFRRFVATMSTDHQDQFSRILKNYVVDRFGTNRVMDGNTFKRVQSELGRRAWGWLGTNNDELGKATYMLLNHLNEALQRANPGQAQELGKVNESFRLYARMREAAARPGKEGAFSAMDLLNALGKGEAKPGSFAAGDEPLQRYAEVGRRALGERVPGSGPALPAELLHIFTRHGAAAELARGTIPPIGRALKTPGLGAPAGREAAERTKQPRSYVRAMDQHETQPPP